MSYGKASHTGRGHNNGLKTFLSLMLPHLICMHSVNSLYGQIKGIVYLLIRVCSIWYLHGNVQLIRDAAVLGISL
jgi:hypothetical protein